MSEAETFVAPDPHPSKRLHPAVTWLGRGLLALLAPILFYFLAALISGLIPANPNWREPARGITIFIRTNGVHTWLMVPSVAADIDWRGLAPAVDIRNPALAGDYIAFGYGNRDFYLNTPTWADLRPSTALAAAFGRGPSLLHVEHERSPRPNDWQRPIRITADQYRRLAAHIRASFRTDTGGDSLPLLSRGYGAGDVFYEANGGYSALYTCNEWTGEALRRAGIRTGVWTPLADSIMWRLD